MKMRCKRLPKLMAVVGGKHSGKTTAIEHLIAELKSRGYHVGTIKEMVRIPTLDTPATETDRYTNAGAEIIAAVPRQETVIFIKKQLGFKEIISHFGSLDYVLLEGFESEKNLPKIIAAKTADEATEYFDSSVVAISGLILKSAGEKAKAASFKVPMLNSQTDASSLADLVEKNALELRA
jgi:molybdopterin-guanine dinucleotide biosynthesis protein B